MQNCHVFISTRSQDAIRRRNNTKNVSNREKRMAWVDTRNILDKMLKNSAVIIKRKSSVDLLCTQHCAMRVRVFYHFTHLASL